MTFGQVLGSIFAILTLTDTFEQSVIVVLESIASTNRVCQVSRVNTVAN
jgi:hypothetical protein